MQVITDLLFAVFPNLIAIYNRHDSSLQINRRVHSNAANRVCPQIQQLIITIITSLKGIQETMIRRKYVSIIKM